MNFIVLRMTEAPCDTGWCVDVSPSYNIVIVISCSFSFSDPSLLYAKHIKYIIIGVLAASSICVLLFISEVTPFSLSFFLSSAARGSEFVRTSRSDSHS